MLTTKAKLFGAAAVLTLLCIIAAVVFTPLPVSRTEVIRSTPTPRPLLPGEALPALAEAANPEESSSRPTDGDILSLPASGEGPAEFILKQYGDSIGVFEAGAEYPFMTIEVPVSSLRAADAEQLRAGISVLGRMELARLVEDLGS